MAQQAAEALAQQGLSENALIYVEMESDNNQSSDAKPLAAAKRKSCRAGGLSTLPKYSTVRVNKFTGVKKKRPSLFFFLISVINQS